MINKSKLGMERSHAEFNYGRREKKWKKIEYNKIKRKKNIEASEKG